MHIELDENVRAGDRLVALTTLTATAEGTDHPVELQSAVVYELRDGKVGRAGFYYDRDEALRSAGLTAQ
jgi:hypothetical protein